MPSNTTVPQGGSVSFAVNAIDEFGNRIDVTDQSIITSDVPTDRVDGATVSFPTASPHTITATHRSGVSATFTITVIPQADQPAGTLPQTGAGIERILLLAIALLMFGWVLVFQNRRRTVLRERAQ